MNPKQPGYNTTLDNQIKILKDFLQQNHYIQSILNKAPQLDMPCWYLGAGCITQTVWNVLSKYDPMQNIKDYDLVYFDTKKISYEAEDFYIQKAKDIFLDIPVDVKNEARVHLWYQKVFGTKIEPYKSVEEAINCWPTTATSIGVRCCKEKFEVYAPYGLNDLFGMIVRPNKIQVTKKVYLEKVERWRQKWPRLTIVPWE